MSIATYSDLKTKTASWLRRAGSTTYVAEVPDFITLAEARLNRLLGAVETDTTLTGTVDVRTVSISALSMERPIALFLAETGLDEVELTPKAQGTFEYRVSSGKPRFWGINGTDLTFDCPLDTAYPFRFRFRQKFALSDLSPTNWLLTNHPDLYLAAALMWGAGYMQSWENGGIFKQTLDEGVLEVRNSIAQSKRSVSGVDPALLANSTRATYQQLVDGSA